ncbi:MAG: MFS transporter [Alphaproteobacteria bacterium]|nr:MFS transporter [Alphaproteobacteria bacterium]
MTDIAHPNTRAIRNVKVLVLAQALIGAQMPMIFVLGGLAGQSLASNVCWATLPISMIVFGSMTTAPWMSALMQRFGRKAGFFCGVTSGAIGAAIAAYALSVSSFPLFLLGSYFTGIYMSAHGFYRFAAIDTASEAFRPKAMSYVMAGGLASAVIGPQLSTLTSDAASVPFLGTYLAVIGLNVFGAILFLFLDIPTPPKPVAGTVHGRSRMEMLKSPIIIVAIVAAMVSYALMNLVMTSTPLAVVGFGYAQSQAANVVMGHVLAMYVPSFFTGHLILRFGVLKIMTIGLVILAGAGLVALAGVQLMNFYVALILLGIGWNFGFIGASTLLSSAHTIEERGRIQGINDMIVFGMVTVASLSSGLLMNCSGGNVTDGWNSVNYAMVPFLALAGGALIWLMRYQKVNRI